MHVEIWTAEANVEDCGEVGATAVVSFEDDSDSRFTHLADQLTRSAAWWGKPPQGSMLYCERDGALLRIHIVPEFEELEDAEDWPEADRAVKALRRLCRDFAGSRDLKVIFEDA